MAPLPPRRASTLVLSRRRAAAALLFVGVAVAVAALVGAQGVSPEEASDARNKPFFDAGSCYGHHYPRITPTWVNPTISFVPPPGPIIVGEPFQVGVRVASNFEYTLQESFVDLDITNATGLAFRGDGGVEEQEFAGSVPRVDPGRAEEARTAVNFTLRPTPSRMTVTLEAFEGSLAGTPGAPDLDLIVEMPVDHRVHAAHAAHGADTPPPARFESRTVGTSDESVDIPFAAILDGVPGEWRAIVVYTQGLAPSAEFTLRVQADFDPAKLPAARGASEALAVAHTNTTVMFDIVAAEAGTQTLDVRSKIYLFHAHKPEDEGHTINQGMLVRFLSPTVTVLAEAPAPPPPPDQGFLGLPGFGAPLLAAALWLACRRPRARR